jgi:hypothetical protein
MPIRSGTVGAAVAEVAVVAVISGLTSRFR